MQMLLKVFALAAALAACHAKDCGFPNGTATAVHHYTCKDGLPTTTTAFQITGKDGKVAYPTHIYDVYVHQTIKNTGPQYDSLLIDVGISAFKSTILKPDCHWSALPTFGLTSNLDWCEQSKACPLKKGDNKMVYYLDLKKFKAIIDLLSEGYTYELRFALHTKDKEQVGCLAIQTKIVKE